MLRKILAVIITGCVILTSCGKTNETSDSGESWFEYHEIIEETEEELRAKNTPSDIVGMSVFDKVEAGLLPWHNSDTDRDGLSDAYELICGTDPLCADSVGDGLPDGYRAFGGTDRDDLFLAPEELVVHDMTADNALMLAYKRQYYGAQGKAVCAYAIEDYRGEVSVDFTEQISQQSDGDWEAVKVNYTTGQEEAIPIENGVVKTAVGEHTIIALYNRAVSATGWDTDTFQSGQKGDLLAEYLVLNDGDTCYDVRIKLDMGGYEDYKVRVTQDSYGIWLYSINYHQEGNLKQAHVTISHEKKYQVDRTNYEFYDVQDVVHDSMVSFLIGMCNDGVGEDTVIKDGVRHQHDSQGKEVHEFINVGDTVFEVEVSTSAEKDTLTLLSKIQITAQETSKEPTPCYESEGYRYYILASSTSQGIERYKVGIPENMEVIEYNHFELFLKTDSAICRVKSSANPYPEKGDSYMEGYISYSAYIPVEGFVFPVWIHVRNDTAITEEAGESIIGKFIIEKVSEDISSRHEYKKNGSGISIKNHQITIPAESLGTPIETDESGTERYVSAFNQATDASPVLNFPNYISKGGLCAGFSYVTALIYEGNQLQKKAAAEISGKSYSYDLENKGLDDLLVKGAIGKVYEGDAKHFFNVNAEERESLSEKDAAFTDFFGYYWALANSKGGKFISAYNFTPDYDVINRVIEFFKSNPDRLLICGLSKYGASHSVNIYGVEHDANNPDVWYLLVYDSNYPIQRIQSETYGGAVDMRIRVTKKVRRTMFGDAVEEYFTYYYKPTADGIEYSSDIDTDSLGGLLLQHHGLSFRDSQLNDL